MCPHNVRTAAPKQNSRMRYVSEGPVRITRAAIEKAWRRRRADTCLSIRDAECRGLSLVVNPTTMAWRYSYKPRGVDPLTGRRFASRSMTLGMPETHSPDAAWTAANQIKGQAKAGEDPAARKRAK